MKLWQRFPENLMFSNPSGNRFCFSISIDISEGQGL